MQVLLEIITTRKPQISQITQISETACNAQR